MPTNFLDAAGRDAPTCRECGSLCVTRDGRVTCSACGYVAGSKLSEAYEHGFRHVELDDLPLLLGEARDEGHAAGRAEALDEVGDVLRCVLDDSPYHVCNCSCSDIRALAGKL